MKVETFIKNKIHYLMLPSSAKRIIHEVRNRNLTYLSQDRLVSVAHLILRVERNNIPGDIIEAGCALGGSAILLSALKSQSRGIKVYDVFGMIPEPSEKDGTDVQERYKEIVSGKSRGIGGDAYYGYAPDLKMQVVESFSSFGMQLSENNIELIEGLIQETLRIDSLVSLAHIDVDWYESVMISLLNIEPKLSAGGSIVIDDYYDWSGCRRAVDEYFSYKMGDYTVDDSSGSLILTKRLSK
jgi:O-methyltransferase